MFDMNEHLWRQLVPALRPALLGYQAGKASRLESGVCLIGRRQRDAEQAGRCGNRFAIDEMPPHHLVTDL